MSKPDGERVAALEQRMTDFSDRLTEIGQDVKEVKALVQTKLSDHISMFDKISGLEREINAIKEQSFLWKWLSPTLAAIFGGSVVFLITEYFRTH